MTKLVNRAKMTTATTGTGTITLGSAVDGYQSFGDAGVINADVVRYVIEDGTDWEIGTGTYTATGTTLTRTVAESSNADAALNLSGSAVVYVSAAAEDIPPVLELYAENPSSPTAPSATGTNAVAIGSGSDAVSDNCIAIGTGSYVSGIEAVAVGAYARADGNNRSSAFGYAADAGAFAGSTALGYLAVSQGTASTALTKSYASGTDSFAAAIANNTATYGATGANSVAIGYQAKATSQYGLAVGGFCEATSTATTALGYNSSASGNFSTAIGRSATASATSTAVGYIVNATGSFSTVIGSNSSATQFESTAIGSRAVSSISGKLAYAGGRFSINGDAQTGTFVLRSYTTDATPEALTTNNSTASTTNQIILPNNSAYAFHGTVVARQQASAGTACAAWKIEGLIRREGSAGTTVLVNSATTVLDNTPGWGMALSADTTNGGLKIEVTGAAATNIRWVANVTTAECTY